MYKIQADCVSGVYYVRDFDDDVTMCKTFDDFRESLYTMTFDDAPMAVTCTEKDLRDLAPFGVTADYR